MASEMSKCDETTTEIQLFFNDLDAAGMMVFTSSSPPDHMVASVVTDSDNAAPTADDELTGNPLYWKG